MKVKSKLNKKFIPVSIPYISNQDIKSVNKVLKKSWISSDGPEVKSFEEKFSKKIKCSSESCGSCNTGWMGIPKRYIR